MARRVAKGSRAIIINYLIVTAERYHHFIADFVDFAIGMRLRWQAQQQTGAFDDLELPVLP